jgi:hypothetical protein
MVPTSRLGVGTGTDGCRARDGRPMISGGLLPNVLDCLAQALGIDVLHFLAGLPRFTRLGRIPPSGQFRTPLSFRFVNLIQDPNPPLKLEVATEARKSSHLCRMNMPVTWSLLSHPSAAGF